jgi:predicted fused transcriptional regulator/phosphomethylpyrimidine kinase/predicted transcriptional regulator
MRPPCEIVYKRLLPILRALVAQQLVELGWTQEQIAKRLGITQAAVSNYLGILKRSEGQELLSTPKVLESAKRIASKIDESGLTIQGQISEVCDLCISLRCGGVTCQVHRAEVPELSAYGCQICYEIFTKSKTEVDMRTRILADVRDAISKLEGSSDFVEMMPQVMVNLAYALPQAKTASDVAAIPGRIAKIHGRPKALMHPEFGASSHLAAILLAAMSVNPGTRSCINVKYDVRVANAIEQLNFSKAELEVSSAEISDISALYKRAKETFSTLQTVPDVMIDKGRIGIESITYVFGSTPMEVVEKVLKLTELAVKV